MIKKTMDWPRHSDIESIEPGVYLLLTPLAFYKRVSEKYARRT